MSAFDEARAACVERFGEPTDVYAVSALARMWWAMSWDGENGVLLAETRTGAAELSGMIGVACAARWPIRDPAGLRDAIDAAVRWMAVNTPTAAPVSPAWKVENDE